MASGDPRPDGVVLWTRVSAPGRLEVPVSWTVAADPELDDVVAAGDADARASRDFTVHVDVAGLQPATTYWYAFTTGALRSPIGRTRTAPRGDVDRVRLGVVCCAHWATGFFNVYGRLAEREVDAVVHLGDYLYEDESRKQRSVRAHHPPGRLVTLADYRARHAQYKTDADLAALHRRHPLVPVWDDHELAGNAWRDGAVRHEEATDGDWATRRDAAVRAYWEWMPLRRPDPRDPLRLWRTLTFGSLCDLVLLDTRIAGREQPAAGSRPVVGVRQRDRSLLGDRQRRWLDDELTRRERSARWRVLASQVIVAPVHAFAVPGWADAVGRRLGAVNGGLIVNSGQWDGYPGEQQRLLRQLADRPGETLVVSGDLHSSWVNALGPAGGPPAAAEFGVPSVSAPSFARALAPKVPGGRALLERVIRAANPHVRWVDTASHGYVLLDVTAEQIDAEWWHVDTLRRRDRGERLAAAWSVTHGDPSPVPRRPGAALTPRG